jgi:ABC-2 type transport system permease protein
MSLCPSYREQVWAIADVEFRKMLRDPTEIFSRAVQPILWLLIFGQVFSRLHEIPTGGLSYIAFMAPGVLAQSVLFCAIFYGINVIWEKDMGVIHKLLVSPASRSALVLGKALSSGFRGLVQAVIIYLMALLMRIGLNLTPWHILGVLAAVVLGSAIFSTFSLIIACWVKSRDRFMGIGQVLTMPIFFASSAIYPIAMMPPWLKLVARFNPLTYLVDALRTLMIRGALSAEGLGFDFLVMAVVFAVFITAATRLYPNLIR